MIHFNNLMTEGFTMKRLVLVIVILFFSSVLFSQTRDGKFERNDRILEYVNLTQNNFVEIFHALDTMNVRFVFVDSIGEKDLTNVESYKKLSGDIFYKLRDIDFINEWRVYTKVFGDIDTNMDRAKYLNTFLGDMDLFYCGKINLSDDFSSHLILKYFHSVNEVGMVSTFSDLYLVNSIDGSIKSITKIAHFFEGEGHSKICYSRKNRENMFEIIEREIFSDIIIESSYNMDDSISIYYSKYCYDSKGYLMVK